MSAYGGAFGPHPSERGCDVFDLMMPDPALLIHNELEKPGEAKEPSRRRKSGRRINVQLAELLEAEGKDFHRGVQKGGQPGLAFRTKPQYVRKQRGSENVVTPLRIGRPLPVRPYHRRSQRIEITPAERQAKMGPVQQHAPAMMRLEESLAHRLERDVRLLLYLKDRDARAGGTCGNTSPSEEARLPKPVGPGPGCGSGEFTSPPCEAKLPNPTEPAPGER